MKNGNNVDKAKVPCNSLKPFLIPSPEITAAVKLVININIYACFVRNRYFCFMTFFSLTNYIFI